MAIPSSGPLSITTIRTELGQAQGNNSLRTLSSLAGKSSPDAMSEFYGYSPSTAIFFVNNGTVNDRDACSLGGGEFQLYWSGSGCPSTGNTLYTDSSLTTPFNGEYMWWKSYECNAAYYIMDNGFIEGTQSCG